MVLVPEHMVNNMTQRKPSIPLLTAQVDYLDSEMDSPLAQREAQCLVLYHGKGKVN